MKKSFKLTALLLASMALAVACNNTPAPEEPVDTIDTTVVDEPAIDTIVEDTVPAPVEDKAPAAKPAKKKEVKKAVTETKTEGGKVIGAINTTEKTVKKEKAITNGEFKR